VKVLVLAAQKGGVGKTTLAGHLAVEAESAGMGPVVLIDADPQGSLAAWWNARESQTPLFANVALPELPGAVAQLREQGVALVVVDTAGRLDDGAQASIGVADLVLLPVRPSPHDLRAIGPTVDLVNAAGRPFAFVVSQAIGRARLTNQLARGLAAQGRVAPTDIHHRVVYAESMIDGRVARELEPSGSAAQEITALWSWTANLLE
jgi:chromosome partitioning protein